MKISISLTIIIIVSMTALSAQAEVYGEIRPDGGYSIVGLWHLNGDATDSSGNGNHGSVSGATVTQFGTFGPAYDFDSDTINMGDAFYIQNAITIACWVNPDDLSSNEGYLVSKYKIASGGREWALWVNAVSGKLSLNIGAADGASFTAVSSSMEVLTNGQWSWIVGTRTGTTGAIYVDGEAQSKIDDTLDSDDFYNSTTDLIIGDRDGGGRDFNGQIDEVCIWDRALSAKEIRELYNYMKGV